MGFTAGDLRHATLLASLPEDIIPKLAEAAVDARDRAMRRWVRKLARQRES
jgi:hypothetical protein